MKNVTSVLEGSGRNPEWPSLRKSCYGAWWGSPGRRGRAAVKTHTRGLRPEGGCGGDESAPEHQLCSDSNKVPPQLVKMLKIQMK